ncbi:hypothetical protein GCM10023191_002020 [Actinoallomurus oryzae]|uniref:Uncharacterized protein n=1 Tax=Actinoallomurus oryzae TaxID=502180 RepID=A0ABP8P692_9ACTN
MDSGAAAERKRPLMGCLIVGLFLSSALFAGLMLLFSSLVTVEAESPEDFPGLRDNNSDIALIFLVLAVLVTVALGILVVAFRRSHIARTVAGTTVCGLLLAVAAYRSYTLIPMLKCGHNAVARQVDGSYECRDR